MTYQLAWAGEEPVSKNYYRLERYIFHQDIIGNVVTDQVIWV